ncbi:MAG: hypothetical protein AAF492_33445, partial [Verrucomicrobiota bacterium]
VDGDILVITASNLPPGAVFPPVTNGPVAIANFNWPAAAPAGVYMPTFYATDRNGSVSTTITITVESGVAPDTDGDGCSDFAEMNIFFTDILDSNDCPRIFITSISGGVSRLEYDSISGMVSTIEFSTNVITTGWTPLATVTGDQPRTIYFDTQHLNSVTNRLYYRVRHPDKL